MHGFKSPCLLLLLMVVHLPLYVYAESWKWIVYGDTRSNDFVHRQILLSIVNKSPDYKFIINTGDCVAHGDIRSEWEDFEKACNDLLGGMGQDQIPPKYMACPGNHDATRSSIGLANWIDFLQGQAREYGNDGLYFVFDYKNARFVIMDSDNSSITGPQYDMLLDAVKHNPKTWFFVFWHHPIFDFGPKSYQDSLHNTWGVPLYLSGCDIIFNGHAHYYVRTKKLKLNGDKNPPLDPENGTVQIVTGTGGADLVQVYPDHDGNGYMLASDTSDYGYCELTVEEKILRVKFILKNGTVVDEAIYNPNPKSDISITLISENAGSQLLQNHPNPFNSTTIIKFQNIKHGNVNLSVYNLRGELVSNLISERLLKGFYHVEFDASSLSSGVYFYRLVSLKTVVTNKMILMR